MNLTMHSATYRRFRLIRCRGLAAVLASSLAPLASVPGNAADYDLGPIHISQTWSRATPKGAAAAAAYLTIINNGKEPDRVNCVSSDASAQCEIHSMTMDDGVMKMRPVEGGLEIKPGETVTLRPGGLHIMLLSLKHPLEQGGMVKTTLKFDKAGTIDVEYPVAAIGAPAPGGGQTGGGGMMMEPHHGGMMQMNPR
jgi:copper(I)-binding protein